MKVGPQAQAGNLGQSHNGPLTGKNANILYWTRLLRSVVESLQHNNRILDYSVKIYDIEILSYDINCHNIPDDSELICLENIVMVSFSCYPNFLQTAKIFL